MEQKMDEKIKQLANSIGLTRQERIESYSKWAAYWNHIANNHAKRKGFCDLFEQDIVQMLKTQKIFDRNSHVLDVGCGSGAYTLDFAKNSRKVTAVDMSKNMLSVLKKRSAQVGITNITCKQALYENLPDEIKYDLVFAAMCPAICDYESLVKFEQLSKQYCCLVTVAKGSVSNLRKSLRTKLTHNRLKGLSPDVIDQFDLLYEWGRYPNIQFLHFTADSAMPLKQAIETYQIYYDIFGFNQSHHQQIINDYLVSIAQNGMCVDRVTYHMAVMWWKVNTYGDKRKEDVS